MNQLIDGKFKETPVLNMFDSMYEMKIQKTYS